jgi:hypothetical protein
MSSEYEVYIIGSDGMLTYHDEPLCIFNGNGSIVSHERTEEDAIPQDVFKLHPREGHSFLVELGFDELPKSYSNLSLDCNHTLLHLQEKAGKFKSFTLVEPNNITPATVKDEPSDYSILYRLFTSNSLLNINQIHIETIRNLLIETEIICDEFYYKGRGKLNFSKVHAKNIVYVHEGSGVGEVSCKDGSYIEQLVISNGSFSHFGEVTVKNLYLEITKQDNFSVNVGSVENSVLHLYQAGEASIYQGKEDRTGKVVVKIYSNERQVNFGVNYRDHYGEAAFEYGEVNVNLLAISYNGIECEAKFYPKFVLKYGGIFTRLILDKLSLCTSGGVIKTDSAFLNLASIHASSELIVKDDLFFSVSEYSSVRSITCESDIFFQTRFSIRIGEVIARNIYVKGSGLSTDHQIKVKQNAIIFSDDEYLSAPGIEAGENIIYPRRRSNI